jgi:hypothetical protein
MFTKKTGLLSCIKIIELLTIVRAWLAVEIEVPFKDIF